MKLNLTPRERQTIIAGGILATLVLWLYFAYLIGPLVQECGRLGQQIRTAKDEVRLLEAGTANEAALREQHRQVNESVQALRKLLPASSELSETIERLSELASQAQVKIQTIAPQREEAGTAPDIYHAILITINALAGYHQLGTFLSLVEVENRPMEVASLWISPDAKELKRHHIKLVLRAYFAAEEGAGARSAPRDAASSKQPGRS